RGECGRRRSGAGISAVIREWKKPEPGGDRVTTNRHDAVSGGNSESGRQLVKHLPARVDQFFVSLDHTEINFGAIQLQGRLDRKSTRLNSSHVKISYAVFCLKKKKKINK